MTAWEWLGIAAVGVLIVLAAFVAIVATIRCVHSSTTTSGDEKRTAIDLAAKITAAFVLVAGAVFVVLPAVKHHGTLFGNPYEPRMQTTTIRRTFIGNAAAPRITRTVTRIAGRKGTHARTTVVTETAGKKTDITTTTGAAPSSFFERALAASGLLFLRFGLLVVAAFLAGAMVQRTLLGRFAFKLGPLELPELAEASKDAIAKVQASFKRQVSGLAGQLERDRKERVSATAQASKLVTATTREIDDLKQRIEELEKPRA